MLVFALVDNNEQKITDLDNETEIMRCPLINLEKTIVKPIVKPITEYTNLYL